MRRILGVFNGQHDSSACLIDDNLLENLHEERLNRKKYSGGIPFNSINELMKDKPKLTEIAIANNSSKGQFEDSILGQLFAGVPIRYFEHHACHQAVSYYTSGFSNSLIITLDGHGDNKSGSVAIAENSLIQEVEYFEKNNSLGGLWWTFLNYCDLHIRSSGTLMAMAALGRPIYADALSNHIYFDSSKGQIIVDSDFVYNLSLEKKNWLQEFFSTISTVDFPDIAASLQKVTESVTADLANFYLKKYDQDNLCLSGGVFLNCQVNEKLRLEHRNVHIPPAPGDSGLALGAALKSYISENNLESFRRRFNPYLGGNINSGANFSHEKALGFGFKKETKKDVYKSAVEDLKNFGIIGWCSGKSEFGPRALGNRSIISNPTYPDIKTKVNQIKGREWFRPVSPVINPKKLEWGNESICSFRYMSFATSLNYSWVHDSMVHLDGSSRIQMVSSEFNVHLTMLLYEAQKTGFNCLLNTSFNGPMEPIVETATDALICAQEIGLKVVYLENERFERI